MKLHKFGIQPLIYFCFSAFLLFGCATPPKIQVRTITKIIRDTIVIKQPVEIEKKDTKIISADLKNYSISDRYSPAVGQDERIKSIILHYTALDEAVSARVLTEQQVSAHYLVPDKTYVKDIYQLVSEDKRAWHAGYSHWNKRDNLNDTSIGIEIVNLGYTAENGEKEFIPFQEIQVKKVAELVKNIAERYEIEPQNILAHSDVAPQRKHDPGPLFPWKELYEKHQIGAWYDSSTKQFYEKRFPYSRINDVSFILSVQRDLAKYGYEINVTGLWDEQAQKVITAFQYHFRPRNYDGILDAETWAILKALIKKYRK